MEYAHPVVDAARAYMDVPFKHQGRNRKFGIDCVGLLINVARDLGFKWTDRRGYARYPDGVTLRAALDEACVPVDGPAIGRIVAFKNIKELPLHVGIISFKDGRMSIIHTWAKVGRVVEHTFSNEFQEAAIGYWAWRS